MHTKTGLFILLLAFSIAADEFLQTRLPDLPNPSRSSFGAAVVRDRIYISGGHQGKEHTYPKESFLDELWAYDIPSEKWIRLTPRPVSAHGYAIVPFGKFLYAFGGFAYSENHKPNWHSLDQVDRYDTLLDRWETIARLPRPRSSYGIAEIDGRVYLLGGWDSTPKFENDFEGRFHPEIEVMSLADQSISTHPLQLPNPLRRALSTVASGREIIMVGGLGVGATHFELLDNVTAFDPKAGIFRELPKLAFPTFAPAVGALGGELFVFGGMHKTGPKDYRYVSDIYRFAKHAQIWQHTQHFLSENKGFAQVVTIESHRLGILGGHSYDGGQDSPVKTFETWEKAQR